MGNYEQLKQSVSDVIKTNGNQEITGSILQNVLLTIISSVGANATFAGIATPTTNPGTPDGPVFYLASGSGTYTNFGGIELQNGLSILMWNGSWNSQQIFGIDNVPTAGSDNLVKSGGVQEELALGTVYDVSAKNPTAGTNNDGKWESLSALLSDANLSTLIPTPVRKGGMSIKFIQSSDNKYVQYRLMDKNFTTYVAQWQGVDETPTANSRNLVESGGVHADVKSEIEYIKTVIEGDNSNFITKYSQKFNKGNFTLANPINIHIDNGETIYIYAITSEEDLSIFSTVNLHIRKQETIVFFKEVLHEWKIRDSKAACIEFTSSEAADYIIDFNIKATSKHTFYALISKNALDSSLNRINSRIGAVLKNEIFNLPWYQATLDGGNNFAFSEFKISTKMERNGIYQVCFPNNVKLFLRRNSSPSTREELKNCKAYEFSIGDGLIYEKKSEETFTLEEFYSLDICVNKIHANQEANYSLENGTFDGAGNPRENTDTVRTTEITPKEGYIYVATCPNTLKIGVNYDSSGNIQFATGGISVKANQKIRFKWTRSNGGSAQIENLTEKERESIKVFEIKSKSTQFDIVIASSESYDYDKADLICDGSNDQLILNAVLGCINDIKILLLGGRYYMHDVYTTCLSGQQCILMTNELKKTISSVYVCGEMLNRQTYEETPTLYVTQDCHNALSSSTPSALMLIPRKEQSETSMARSNTIISIKNIQICGYGYEKPIVYIDATHANAAKIEEIAVYGDAAKTGTTSVHTFETKPNEKCVGIRVGQGSNNGIQNKVKNSMLAQCGTGVSCCGEHFVFEDVLAHHCYYGFAFGDRATRGNFEHPNIMIGCSIESCYRLMYLTKGGITTEGEFVQDPANNLIASTLICIGLSTEEVWNIPTDEQIEGQPVTARTLPILEVLKGAYRGRIELDFLGSNIFESGSGRAFTWRQYKNGQLVIGHGNIIEETYG